jgi:microsomal epoxide hydrolase
VSRFVVSVDDEVLDDLRRRLATTRWPDTVSTMPWEHGADLDYLLELVEYWVGDFDWRAQEAMLNEELPGELVRIRGYDVHYARVPATRPSALPLLLLHGWPGSYFEMYKLAPALAGDFDVVVPSLPGHGFSSIPSTTGFGADECADVMHALMTEVLGFERYGAQGGDRGAFVSTGLAHRYPDAVAGIHLNLAGGIPGDGAAMTEDERQWLLDTQHWLADEGGYIAIQGTRPQTLAYGLHDSPVGMLAWIVEKWWAWSDCGGDIESCFTKDELLTNAMLYWVTDTMRSSMHYYWEHRTNPPAAVRPVRIEVPTAVAMFPKEVMRVPRSAAERKYDLRRWTEFERGGHFAAMEQPVALATDIREFFLTII